MQPGFLKFFYDDILKNKKLVLSAIITTILGFGFTITNFSIGIDDPAAIHYFHTTGSGNMIQQGRLFQVLYDKLTGAEQFIPFFNDFVAAVLFMFSALMFSGLFQYVTDRRFSDIALMIFQCVYISFSMICDKYIFNLDVVVTMASYLLIAYSLAASYEYVYYKKKQSFVAAVLALTIGIGSYEPFLFLYICGVCAIMILKCVVGEEKLKFRDTFREALLYCKTEITDASALLYRAVSQYIWHTFCPWKDYVSGRTAVLFHGGVFPAADSLHLSGCAPGEYRIDGHLFLADFYSACRYESGVLS